MTDIPWPIDVERYFHRARTLVLAIAADIPIESAVLDDWNTGRGITGARIIYGGPMVETCQSACRTCPLFQKVGTDRRHSKAQLRTSLCLAAPEQQLLFPSKQRFLNCKTLEQYQEAFICYVLQCCHLKKELEAELAWIKGFRLVFMRDLKELDQLKQKEFGMKQYIVAEILKRLQKTQDQRRIEIVLMNTKDWA